MIGAAALALLVTISVTPVVSLALARYGLVDHPNARSSHVKPTLRGGGIAVAIGALLAIATSPSISSPILRSVLLTSSLFGLIGLLDDLLSVAPLRRLGLQVLASIISLPYLFTGITGTTWWRLLFAVGVLLLLVGFVNAFNFMDGINGISVAQSVVAGMAFAAIGHWRSLDSIATAGAVLGAGALGFAPFNFPKARIFLGDVGSYFLGAWVATLIVLGLRAGLPVEAVFAPVVLYLADTISTFFRRIRQGSVWYEAHHEHVYQLLVERGWSHTRTASLVFALATVCAGLGAVSLGVSVGLRVAADVALAMVVGLYLVLPSIVGRFNVGAHNAHPAPRVS